MCPPGESLSLILWLQIEALSNPQIKLITSMLILAITPVPLLVFAKMEFILIKALPICGGITLRNSKINNLKYTTGELRQLMPR
jgi:hypothetical protein